MKKNTLIGLVVLLALAAGIAIISGVKAPANNPSNNNPQSKAFDGRNSTFTIDGKSVTLVNGVSEVSIPNSSAKITTNYFGNEAKGDLNGDGREDIAFLVTQNTGGSGTFYYAVVALANADGSYKTTNAFLIGDRIAPQTMQIHSDSKQLDVNYAERKPEEPMTVRPSVGVTKVLKVSADGALVGVEKQDNILKVGFKDKQSALGVSIETKEIVGDSRCPVGAQCIQAGTVAVDTIVTVGSVSKEQIFRLGGKVSFPGADISFIDVLPAAAAGKILRASDYKFFFRIDKTSAK